MTGFEPRTSWIGSDSSTNWATTTARFSLVTFHLGMVNLETSKILTYPPTTDKTVIAIDVEWSSLMWLYFVDKSKNFFKACSDQLQTCCNQRLSQSIAVIIEIFPIFCSDLAFCYSSWDLRLVWSRLDDAKWLRDDDERCCKAFLLCCY